MEELWLKAQRQEFQERTDEINRFLEIIGIEDGGEPDEGFRERIQRKVEKLGIAAIQEIV